MSIYSRGRMWPHPLGFASSAQWGQVRLATGLWGVSQMLQCLVSNAKVLLFLLLLKCLSAQHRREQCDRRNHPWNSQESGRPGYVHELLKFPHPPPFPVLSVLSSGFSFFFHPVCLFFFCLFLLFKEEISESRHRRNNKDLDEAWMKTSCEARFLRTTPRDLGQTLLFA